MQEKPKESCKMLIRLWNPDNEDWDIITVDVPGHPKAGPSDEYIEVLNSNVEPDENGDFIHEGYAEEDLDAVHAFAISRLTIDLWEMTNGVRLAREKRLSLVLYDKLNGARYNKYSHSIRFGKYGPRSMPTCRSLDVVSHETTHAILERIDFNYPDTSNIELLCDLTPMFLQFANSQILSWIVSKNHIDFNIVNPISEFAEGYTEPPNRGIRSVFNKNYDNQEPFSSYSIKIKWIYKQLGIIQELDPFDRNKFLNLFKKQLIDL
jgi:hypothetical protein